MHKQAGGKDMAVTYGAGKLTPLYQINVL